ncbi:NIF3-like protein 1 isoform X3 [Orussus abietinus]|uniref:NIF3-like protein 1 isoform X3 n=1 Tax=Orussus abietinus TaxID=222816 RepID=UPI000625AFEC|nr:NIF3-like protein 1 isoform X3 [Orussus abietinus]XP_012272532.1 NIF3-like protein 1 isoform X3 [Orussus abietinus]XP_012272533.1 NIF3-like protein 1 isoform X3 [Orussus abietinus]XP_012272535.1 NIF3-like protein 1 isoform X3 [Orussus abietinus]XP_012272536.1 NIF3-like protein 1 isoform X3 [Orussus abietinus]
MLRYLPKLLGIKEQTLFFNTVTRTKYSICAMGEAKLDSKGIPLSSIIGAIQSFADTSLAASWDNVGLLIEPTEPIPIKHILLTNDLTENVIQEAVDLQVGLVISYHPPIFAPLKSVTTRTWKERIVARCLENKISLYSPHTSFDSIRGGVNDWLASAFDLENSNPIEPGTKPENGMGRICQLKNPISVMQAVELVKRHTGLSHVRLARAVHQNGDLVKTVALCAGSGSSVLKNVSADLYLTGEMLHHDVLDAVHNNVNVILTNHSDSERGFLKHFADKLLDILETPIKISVSKADEDPLKTV